MTLRDELTAIDYVPLPVRLASRGNAISATGCRNSCYVPDCGMNLIVRAAGENIPWRPSL